MPQNKFALARYRIIDAMLRRYDYVTSAQLVEGCAQRTGFRLSRRTIQLDIEAMRHDPFLGYYAPIGYCTRRKAYFYEQRDYVLHPFAFTDAELALLEGLVEKIRRYIG